MSMSYEQALRYIHSVSWKGSVLGLSRTRELLGRMGNPQHSLRFVHVAGTNGKGSFSAMLQSVLSAAGYRTGLYTSPFIARFNERMQIDGAPIGDETLACIAGFVRPLADSMADAPTEFELITCIAMEYFRRNACEFVVLETGMGGALDATNVIDAPALAVIMAMGLDHMDYLGTTVAQIAEQKAGIVKENGCVLNYGNDPAANAVFERVCRQRHARLFYADFSAMQRIGVDLDGQAFSYWGEPYRIPLIGAYQIKNAAMVLRAVEILRMQGVSIAQSAVKRGLENARWPARFEVLCKDPVVIVDGGHNPQGVAATAESLNMLFPREKIVFLIGMMADKDVVRTVQILLPLAKAFIAVRPDNPRAMLEDVLAGAISELGGCVQACPSVEMGVRRALAGRSIVCAVGSLYMADEVKRCVEAIL